MKRKQVTIRAAILVCALLLLLSFIIYEYKYMNSQLHATHLQDLEGEIMNGMNREQVNSRIGIPAISANQLPSDITRIYRADDDFLLNASDYCYWYYGDYLLQVFFDKKDIVIGKKLFRRS